MSGPEDKSTSADLSEEQWREKLGVDRYRVLREGGTERAFTGEYNGTKTPGTYKCSGCGEPLFDSKAKYDSGSGWPSFTDPMADGRVETRTDDSHGMVRTEILCAGCGGHLGHVFPDGPGEAGTRYCVNSLSLKLEEREED